MWQLPSEKESPIYQQIVRQIIDYIQSEKLLPGDKLPPERQLAQSYQVNRSTVVRALEELVSLGWISRRQGSGTIVNEGKWGRLSEPRVNWRRQLSAGILQEDPFQSALRKVRKDPAAIDLYTGELPLNMIPDFQLPSYSWEELLHEEARQDSAGYLPLKRLLRHDLSVQRGIASTDDEILITSGAQQALFLLLQTILKAGDSVAIEDPSFLYALPIFEAAGIRLYGVAQDQEGIMIDSLEQVIQRHRVKLILVNPTFQNPTGAVMSLRRRQELLALSRRYQLPIVEDDVFGELRFSDTPPPLKALAPDQVVYIGSLSKIFGSSIKIGWIVADSELITSLAKARGIIDFSLSVFPQVLAYAALKDPRHDDRQKQLVAAMETKKQLFFQKMTELSEWSYTAISGGLYSWLTFNGRPLTRKDWELFLQEKLLIAPAFLFGDQTNSLRLNYTRLDEENSERFIRALKKITQNLMKAGNEDE